MNFHQPSDDRETAQRHNGIAAVIGLRLTDPIWFAAIGLLAVLQLSLIVTHRPWLDEWQALQIAVQSPSLSDLLTNLRYEGHPPLWYLILRGTASFLPIPWVLPSVAAAFALAGQAALLFASPFSRFDRLCIAFGEFVLFEYFTVSRSLTIGACALLLAMTLRRSRWAWLPIALLPMCDFLFGVLSCGLIALLRRDDRLWLPGLALWLISGAVAAWSVSPAPDMVTALAPHGAAGLFYFIDRLGVLLVPVQTVSNVISWNGTLPFGIGIVAGPLFLWFSYRQLRHDLWHVALFGGFVLICLVFSLAVYPLQTRHLTLIALFLILLAWRSRRDGATGDLAFRAWLAIGALCGLATAAVNLARPFDTAELAARYIRQHGLTEKHWLVFPESRAQGVSAITGIEFHRIERQCMQSFVRWDRGPTITSYDALEASLRAVTRRYGRVYLLSDFRPRLPADLARPLATFPPGYDGQAYYLTLVGPHSPETSLRPPPCPPRRRRLT